MCTLCLSFWKILIFFALDGVCFKNKNDIVKINLIPDFRLCVMFVPFE